jgi:hypothetical protein
VSETLNEYGARVVGESFARSYAEQAARLIVADPRWVWLPGMLVVCPDGGCGAQRIRLTAPAGEQLTAGGHYPDLMDAETGRLAAEVTGGWLLEVRGG